MQLFTKTIAKFQNSCKEKETQNMTGTISGDVSSFLCVCVPENKGS